MLKCMCIIENICCRNHINIAHISADTGFWTYVDRELFINLSEYFSPLKPVPFLVVRRDKFMEKISY
jgi:hypothetical protein